MKYLKSLLMIVAVLALIVAGVLIFRFALDTQLLMGAAQRYDSGARYVDPFQSMWLILAASCGGAFLLGLGLGLPRRSSRAIREDALEAASPRSVPPTTDSGRPA